MDITHGTNLEIQNHKQLNVFGKPVSYPINFRTQYTFALISYLMIPVFVLFGSSIYSLKIFAIVSSLLFLILCYFIIKNKFGRFTGSATVLFTSMSPVFIYAVWTGIQHMEIIINLFFAASLLCIIRYLRHKKACYLFLGAFLAGLPLSVKLSSMARYIAFTSGMLLYYYKYVVAWFAGEKKIRIAWAFIFVMLGGTLFFQYNLLTKGEILRYTSRAFSKDKPYMTGDNTGNLILNFKVRCRQAYRIIAEEEYYFAYEYFPERLKVRPSLALCLNIFYLAAIIANIGMAFLPVNRKEKKVLFFIYTVFFIMFFLSTISPTSIDSVYLYMMYPFFQFNAALFIRNITRWCKKQTAVSMLAAAVFMIPYTGLMYRYMDIYRRTGGGEIGSPATDDMIRYLEEFKPFPVYEINKNQLFLVIPFLTAGKVEAPKYSLQEFLHKNFPLSGEEGRKKLLGFILDEFVRKNRETAYFLLNLNNGFAQVKGKLFMALQEAGYKIEKVKVFTNNIGEVHSELYRAQRTVQGQ